MTRTRSARRWAVRFTTAEAGSNGPQGLLEFPFAVIVKFLKRLVPPVRVIRTRTPDTDTVRRWFTLLKPPVQPSPSAGGNMNWSDLGVREETSREHMLTAVRARAAAASVALTCTGSPEPEKLMDSPGRSNWLTSHPVIPSFAWRLQADELSTVTFAARMDRDDTDRLIGPLPSSEAGSSVCFTLVVAERPFMPGSRSVGPIGPDGRESPSGI